jgi:hypothetical protein
MSFWRTKHYTNKPANYDKIFEIKKKRNATKDCKKK